MASKDSSEEFVEQPAEKATQSEVQDDGETFLETLVERARQSEEAELQGAVRDDGTINWECPCIQREVVGPCGVEFRNAFSAYVDMKSDESKKISTEFVKAVKEFNSCSMKFPEYYYTPGKDDDDEDDDDDDDESFDNGNNGGIVEMDKNTDIVTKPADKSASSEIS